MASNNPSTGRKNEPSVVKRAFNNIVHRAKNRPETGSSLISQPTTPGTNPPASIGSPARLESSNHDLSHLFTDSLTGEISMDSSGSSLPALTTPTPNNLPPSPPPAIGDSPNVVKGTLDYVWSGLEVSLRELHRVTNRIPPLQSAVSTLISSLDRVRDATKNRQGYQDLATDLTEIATVLGHHLGQSEFTSISDSVANAMRALEMEAGYIRSRMNQRAIEGVLRVNDDADDLLQCYCRIRDVLRLLKLDAVLGTWATTNETLASNRLESLLPAKSAYHDSAVPANVVRSECTENTRIDVLAEMMVWSENLDAPQIYWLNGMAGTGKTTIACSLSAALAERKQLAASFFCTRMVEECRDVARIIPTIAYQLAQYSRSFKSALCKVMENNPDIAKRNIMIQFKRLLREPLLEIKDSLPKNVVVVIDALDECDDNESVRRLLETLFQQAADVPLKFFVAGRPEPEILTPMRSQRDKACLIMPLHEVKRSSVQADITLYIRKELDFLSPTKDELQRLVKLSDNLFIFAATAIRYIRSRKKSISPRVRLQAVLKLHPESNNMYAELDALYRTILEGAFDDDGDSPENGGVDWVRSVLWTTVCAREPITIQTLAALAGIAEESTELILQSLQSVLHVSEVKNPQVVTTLHASFPDFIFSRERSLRFFCDKSCHYSLLAQQCFRLMKAELCFNICNLESSYALDENVENMEARIQTRISRQLSYACKHWGSHLALATPATNLHVLLEEFLSNYLLFWMEVLNLTKYRMLGLLTLQLAQSWLSNGPPTTLPDLNNLISDALDFVTLFSSHPVSWSTPHIYISLLPFCHRSSLIFQIYSARTQGLMNVKGAAIKQRGSAAIGSWDVGVKLDSIAVSPDGNLIAFGGANDSSAGMIGIIDKGSGELIVGPFQGHSKQISALAFSSDGVYMASASHDNTICVWNPHDGRQVAGPFQGHSSLVNCISFSPDSSRIVSGSADCTIYIWDTQGHEDNIVLTPSETHTASINSVSFSPDGTRIASGSDGGSVCIWDSQNGKLLAGPLNAIPLHVFCSSLAFPEVGLDTILSRTRRQTDISLSEQPSITGFPSRPLADRSMVRRSPLKGVAFTPDGTRVVSICEDGMIAAWGVGEGTCLAVCWLACPSNTVFSSLALSLDCSRIATSSSDKTVCLWNARDGKLLGGPFKGHANSVSSVALWFDEKRVISGSCDGTICVWSKQDAIEIPNPPRAHNTALESVTFSPDGNHVAACSRDGRIWTWVSQDGNPVFVLPIQQHDHSCLGQTLHSNVILSICTLAPGRFDIDRSFGSVNTCIFSAGGGHVLSGSSDGTIVLNNVGGGPPAIINHQILGITHAHNTVVPPNPFNTGQSLVSRTFDSCSLPDSQTPTTLSRPFRPLCQMGSAMALSSDGTVILGFHCGGICVCSTEEREISPAQAYTRTTSVIPGFSPTTSTCGLSGEICSTAHGAITSMAFSTDHRRFASGCKDGSVSVWRVEGCKLVAGPFQRHTSSVNCLAFSPNDTVVASGSGDGSICVWRAKDGEIVVRLFEAHAESINSVSFSPDGTHFISGSRDRTMSLWSGRDGARVGGPFRGHIDSINAVAFSPDGTQVASASDDCSIRITQLSTDLPLVPTLKGEWDIRPSGWVVNRDGKYLFWVPQHLRLALPRPYHLCVIGPEGALQIDYRHVLLGESWSQCYATA